MKDNWRPDNWEDNKFHACMDLTKGGGNYADIYEVFEAGATEMLKACRENWKLLVPKDHICLLKKDYCLATGVKIE